MTKSYKVELMAPAGSFESMAAAIKAGADSIYFGIEQLNMRARSTNNFTIDDLPEIHEICSKHNVKTYLTLNTILYDHDISLMKKIIVAVKESKIDAVIASDYAVFNQAKKEGVKIHISTQANVSNIDSIEFFSQFSDVVVLARELTLKQVESIVKEIKRRDLRGISGELMKVEIFAHGALCMAVSGKCYLSLHSNYASANRGACIQNCRKSYVVIDKEDGVELEIDNEYIMSAKDLCTIDFLDTVIDTGVKVLKIEGRGRSADYVHTTIQCYREAIDSIEDGTYSREKVALWKERLATVFNRGFWDGYYLGKTIGEWNNEYGSKATKKKIYVAKGLKYYDDAKAGEFRMESHSIALGDEVLIIGPTTGVIQTFVDELRLNNVTTDSVKKGDVFTLPLNEKLRPSDRLYKLVDAQ
ncbi:MAG: peptidase U32 family protein [Bacteroidota bacterium]